MAERPAERVAGAQCADDVDRHRRQHAPLVGGRDEHAVAALLHERELDAAREQRVGGRVGIGLADGDLALGPIANGDGRLIDGRADRRTGFVLGGPERRAIVEVEDRVHAPSSLVEEGAHGRARGLIRERSRADPEDRHRPHDVGIDILDAQLHVRRLRLLSRIFSKAGGRIYQTIVWPGPKHHPAWPDGRCKRFCSHPSKCPWCLAP